MKDKNLVIHSFKIYGNEMPTEARLSGWERPAREPEWEAQEDFPGSLPVGQSGRHRKTSWGLW